ncbi:MAG: hypothetical protein IJ716_11635 [Lachnospiraceae bacterium]|nr:hypothetical protein [Lachnospiraceae bacterium]
MMTLKILKDNRYRKDKSGESYDVKELEAEFDGLCVAMHRKFSNYKPDATEVLLLLIVFACAVIFLYFMDMGLLYLVGGISAIILFVAMLNNIRQMMKAVLEILEKLKDDGLSAEERLDNLSQHDVFQNFSLPFPDKYSDLKLIKRLLESSARCGVKTVNVIEGDRRPDYEIVFNDGSSEIVPGIFCVFYPIEILDDNNKVFTVFGDTKI